MKNVNTHPDEIYTTLYIILAFKAKEKTNFTKSSMFILKLDIKRFFTVILTFSVVSLEK